MMGQVKRSIRDPKKLSTRLSLYSDCIRRRCDQEEIEALKKYIISDAAKILLSLGAISAVVGIIATLHKPSHHKNFTKDIKKRDHTAVNFVQGEVSQFPEWQGNQLILSMIAEKQVTGNDLLVAIELLQSNNKINSILISNAKGGNIIRIWKLPESKEIEVAGFIANDPRIADSALSLIDRYLTGIPIKGLNFDGIEEDEKGKFRYIIATLKGGNMFSKVSIIDVEQMFDHYNVNAIYIKSDSGRDILRLIKQSQGTVVYIPNKQAIDSKFDQGALEYIGYSKNK